MFTGRAAMNSFLFFRAQAIASLSGSVPAFTKSGIALRTPRIQLDSSDGWAVGIVAEGIFAERWANAPTGA